MEKTIKHKANQNIKLKGGVAEVVNGQIFFYPSKGYKVDASRNETYYGYGLEVYFVKE